MKKSRKLLSGSSLRQPFVVTVTAAVAVAASACGGAVASVSPEESGDGEIASKPIDTECPTAEPTRGSGCNLAPSVRCGYRDCMGHPSVDAKCGADGRWNVVQWSCNPPAPPLVGCPETAPTAGDACNVGAWQSCEYGDCPGRTEPVVTATCGARGTWEVMTLSCNPPPPETCPAVQPTAGAPCAVPATVSCGYKDCFGTPSVTATCANEGRWQVLEQSCNPPRPTP